MVRQEVGEAWWLLKWAAALALAGALAAVVIFMFRHTSWQVASFGYYTNFFRELFTNPQYQEGLFQFKLAATLGALIGGLPPILFMLKK
ncbi:hypothetical protein [Diaphorobacter sp.]|uniref:hypothetical protein n=1 Tax=Diaphorobacter sp. TaxID=1934310 RepID=UPI00258991AC|nr:hypothetical protein [Diaphorobacter sp.]